MRKLIAVSSPPRSPSPARSSPSRPSPPRRRSRVDDNVFSPKTIRVKKGDKIRFRWVGDAPHNVKGAGINIGTRTQRHAHGHRQARAGTFRLHDPPGHDGPRSAA